MMDLTAEIKGLKELQRKTDQMVKDLHGAPILNAMRDSTLLVSRYARKNAPVDTGRLRASILPEIRASAGNEILGVVGSNVEYAPYQEFGTRRGIRAKRYLQRAFETAEQSIINRFERALTEVVEK